MNIGIPASFIHRIKAHLKKGGVVAYPTESCFGLGALPHHPKGIKNILKIKKRNQQKGLIVIGYKLSQFNSLIQPLSDEDQKELNAVWPAPITFLLESKKYIYPDLKGRGKTKIAVRIPKHPLARQLCQKIQQPLISTSANKRRKVTIKTERELRRQLGRSVLIISGRVGQEKQNSTIYDFRSKQKIR